MSRKPRRTQGQAWTPDHAGDTVDGITWGQVELEPEASHWLEGLDDQRWAQALFHLDLLRERARRAAGRALHPAAKTRMHESAEISRAARAMDRCLREGHMPDEDEYKEGSR